MKPRTVAYAVSGSPNSICGTTGADWLKSEVYWCQVVAKLEDDPISRRPARRITGSARFPMEYVLADGRGQMVDLAYTTRPERPAPYGASQEKLEQMIASFKFLFVRLRG